MIWRIAWVESSYQLRSVTFVMAFAAFFSLGFLLTANAGEFQTFASGGLVLANSPFAIVENLIRVSVFMVFILPAIVAGALLRDVESGIHPLVYSTPVTRLDFLAGRYLGAFLVLLLIAAGAPAGLLAGTFWPWADATLLGPTHLTHYAFAYFGVMLPTLFSLSALVFAVAVMSRRMIYVYLTVMGLLALSLVGGEANVINPLLDPFMFEVFERQTQYWTATERNQQLMSYRDLVLQSRALWTAIALALLVVAYRGFSFASIVREGRPATPELGYAQPSSPLSAAPAIAPAEKPPRLSAIVWSQFWVMTRWEIRQVIVSKPFVILMSISFALLVANLTSREVHYGVQAYPVTRLMIGSLSSLILALMVVLAFYSSEIIWRDRRSGFSGVLDALPVASGVLCISKVFALLMVMGLIVMLGVLTAVVIQLLSGYSTLEPLLYLERGLFFNTLPYICLAILTCFFQVLSSHRFVGLFLFGIFMALLVGSRDLFGVEHPLASFGLPAVAAPMSDMDGNRQFMALGYWVRAYWVSIAGLLLVATIVLWERGIQQPLKLRIRQAWRQRSAPNVVVLMLLVLGIFYTGSVIYYNTNILNRYVTTTDAEQLQVDYEQQYRKFSSLLMPVITTVDMHVDLFPDESRITVKGTHILENQNHEALLQVHVLFPPDLEVLSVALEGALLVSSSTALATYVIFDLDLPMMPGAQRELIFETQLGHTGFSHGDPDTALASNGLFISNERLAPHIGFNPDYVLKDENKRRRYGLTPWPRRPALEEIAQHTVNPTRRDSRFIDFQTTVSTSATQTAIAPGDLLNRWETEGRRYFHYQMDGPIRNFYAYASANYEVARDQINDIDIEIFHHHAHAVNVNKMMAGARDSLELFSQAFSPYQYKKLSIVEFPGYKVFAQSFPNTVFFSEDIGFLDQVGEQDLDMPYYITAHEVAHQWWGHQLTAANTQGDGFLHETLAQYSAVMVMQQKYGSATVRRFLKYELDRYLSARANDPEGEMPLYRVEKQKYIHYRKGSLVMYALADYLGTDVINRSLKRLLQLRAFSASPYATSPDFLKILKEEAKPDQAGLIEDFLQKVTLFDLKLQHAAIEPLGAGQFRVTLQIDTAKIYADGAGNEQTTTMDLPVDIGLFRRSPSHPGFSDSDVVTLNRWVVDTGASTIELVVDERPTFAGIDPFHKLIDREIEDNLVEIH